jgi:hypothetical protein
VWHSRGAIQARVEKIGELKRTMVVQTEMGHILNQLKLNAIQDDSFRVGDLSNFIRTHLRTPGRDASLDPWGTPYHIKQIGSRILLLSAGPDRQWNTADDIQESIDLQDY